MLRMTCLVDQLGGPPEIAKRLGLQTNTVGNWRKRPIPWAWRPALAQLAADKGVSLPPGFLKSATTGLSHTGQARVECRKSPDMDNGGAPRSKGGKGRKRPAVRAPRKSQRAA